MILRPVSERSSRVLCWSDDQHERTLPLRYTDGSLMVDIFFAYPGRPEATGRDDRTCGQSPR